MKKILASLFLFSFLSTFVHAQDNGIRPQAIGVSFFLNDFSSAERLRTTSLSKVIADKSWAKFNEMAPGIAITYFKGLQKHLDFPVRLQLHFWIIHFLHERPKEMITCCSRQMHRSI